MLGTFFCNAKILERWRALQWYGSVGETLFHNWSKIAQSQTILDNTRLPFWIFLKLWIIAIAPENMTCCPQKANESSSNHWFAGVVRNQALNLRFQFLQGNHPWVAIERGVRKISQKSIIDKGFQIKMLRKIPKLNQFERTSAESLNPTSKNPIKKPYN